MCGAVGGAASLLRRGWSPLTRYKAAFSLTLLLISTLYLLPIAREMLRSEAPHRAGSVLLLALSIPLTAWVNSGYWFRRQLIGAGPALGFRLIAGGLGAVAGLASPLLYAVPEVEFPAKEGPNLILITVDTLRRDHLGAYGGNVHTPNLDRLAREGAIVDDAVALLPETAPSHGSMFTGRHPAEHGLTSNGLTLNQGRITLAEHLALQGYRTGAFVSAFALDSSTGLDQGFQIYDDDFSGRLRGLPQLQAGQIGLKLLMRFGDPANYPELLERAAPDTAARALSWVDAGSGPFFLWVHLFEPHSPYVRHDGQPDGIDHKAILAQEPGYAYSEAEIAKLRELYRLEVEYTDAQIGALLDGLRSRDHLADAAILVTADHGEMLGETPGSATRPPQRFNHHGLYEGVLRVPMLLWRSRPIWEAGATVRGQATVMDVANTLLGAAGLTQMGDTRSESLVNRLMGAEVRPEGALLMGREGMSLAEGMMYGVRAPSGAKYIQHEDRTEEFYDLNSDPLETTDISALQPRAVEIGRQNVLTLQKVPTQAPELDPATRERLEQLGYVSGPEKSPVGAGGCGE